MGRFRTYANRMLGQQFHRIYCGVRQYLTGPFFECPREDFPYANLAVFALVVELARNSSCVFSEIAYVFENTRHMELRKPGFYNEGNCYK